MKKGFLVFDITNREGQEKYANALSGLLKQREKGKIVNIDFTEFIGEALLSWEIVNYE